MTDDPKLSRRDELEALLPFYLNGTLSGADLAAVEEWLASDPAALVALAEAEAEFAGTMAANENIRPPADALRRFSEALDREPARGVSAKSWFAEAWGRMAGLPAGFAWAAAAAAIALLVVQSAVTLTGRNDDFSVAGAKSEGEFFALIVFKPDTRIADISALLDANHVTIASGPTASGVYRLNIPATTAADYDRIVGLLASAPVTESVAPGRKPADGG
jgi:anti-sigma factor RsiW